MKHLDALLWRYATKKMNGQTVPEEKIERILDAIRLSPSSTGLQPYHVIVVTDPELKKKVLPVANNQSQVVDCSHLLIFAAWDNVTAARANDFVALNAKVRNVPLDSLGRVKSYMDSFLARPAEVNFNWAARQSYIALGIGVAAAAMEEVDATPMEGFNAGALDTLLELDKVGLKSITLLPLGYRDAANDPIVSLPKVRWEKERFFIRM